MKNLFSFVVLFCVSTTFAFGADSCASGKCLKGVVGGTVNATSNLVGGAVGLVGNVLDRTGDTVVAVGNGVKTVVSTPARRAVAVTQNTARFAANAVKRPFRRVVCR